MPTNEGGYTPEGQGTPGPAGNGADADYWDPTERATAAQLFEELRVRATQELQSAGMPAAQAGAEATRIAGAAADAYLASRRSGVSAGESRQRADATYQSNIQASGARNNVKVEDTSPNGTTNGAVGATEVQGKDVTDAVNAYRKTTQQALSNYGNPGAVTSPLPIGGPAQDSVPGAKVGYALPGGVKAGSGNFTSTTGPTGGVYQPVKAQPITEAQRLQAALQQGATVGATDTTDLAATAAGQGAGQLASAARSRQALAGYQQTANAQAQQARGADRKGARLAVLAGAGEAGIKNEAQIEAQNAQDRMAAQGKIADIDSARKQAQAQLDQAKAAGDQAAINTAQQKMADLDQQRQQFNSGQAVSVATSNNQQGLAAQGQQETQRVANEELKIKLGEAAQKAAQGLLDEAQREESLKQARIGLQRSEQHYQDALRRQATQDELNQANADRQFWGGLVASLAGGVATVGAAALTSDRTAKQKIKGVTSADLQGLAQAARRSLAKEGSWEYKPGYGDGGGRKVFPMAQAIEKTKLGRTLISKGPDGKKQVDAQRLGVLLALANVRHKKAAR